MSSSCCEHDCRAPDTDSGYRRILWVALGVNLSMFLVEIIASFAAGSVSLRADALDFLADALNYAIALAVIGLSLRWRAGAALVKGGIMALFGLWVAGSIVNHAMLRAVPEAELIGAVGLLALTANVFVATLLYRHRANDSQAMSVWLCTRNDCIANVAVMLAGVAVWISGTPWPDIAVAAVVAYLGLSSAVRIARRAIVEMRGSDAFIGVPAELGVQPQRH
jgi:Co/Zn/Cd efflux system component